MRVLNRMEVAAVAGGGTDEGSVAWVEGSGFCGPADSPLIMALVPESPLGFDMGPACQIHDEDVAAANSAADSNFLANMQLICQVDYADSALCNTTAYVYYGAVVVLGGLFQ